MVPAVVVCQQADMGTQRAIAITRRPGVRGGPEALEGPGDPIPASRLKINDSDEDFGQTFSVWGANRGPYIVLPFFGPSTIKDAVGSSLDFIINPTRLYNPSEQQLFFSATNVVNSRADLLTVENVVFGDKYLFYKNAYLQRREFLELDGKVVDAFDDEF